MSDDYADLIATVRSALEADGAAWGYAALDALAERLATLEATREDDTVVLTLKQFNEGNKEARDLQARVRELEVEVEVAKEERDLFYDRKQLAERRLADAQEALTALADYAEHDYICPRYKHHANTCCCGLDVWLARLQAVAAPTLTEGDERRRTRVLRGADSRIKNLAGQDPWESARVGNRLRPPPPASELSGEGTGT